MQHSFCKSGWGLPEASVASCGQVHTGLRGEEVGDRGFIGPKKGNPVSTHEERIGSAFASLNALLIDLEPAAIAEAFATTHKSRQTDRARIGPQVRSST